MGTQHQPSFHSRSILSLYRVWSVHRSRLKIPRESRGLRSFCVPCRTVEHLLSLGRYYGRKYLSLSLLGFTNTKPSSVPASRFSEHATLLLYFDRVRPTSRLLASLAPRCILYTSYGSRRGSRKAILGGHGSLHGPWTSTRT